jgi:hypothetical protein
MKSRYLFALPALLVFFLLTAYSGMDVSYPSGAPAGYTGSPGDGQNCTACHGGSAAQVTGWITSDIPADGYIPGETYTITLTDSGNGRKGFEVSAQNPAGDFLGSLSPGSGSKFCSGNTNYITHSSSSNSNPKVWTVQWTAPSAGAGDVTFYGAFALNKSATKLSSLTAQENTGTGISEILKKNWKIYPVPARENVNIAFTLENSSEVSIDLYNTAGMKTATLFRGSLGGGAQQLKLDLPPTAPGTYIMKMKAGKDNYSERMVIQ